MKVRLTEEEFKNMISESVKQILTELDFQTYVNTAHERLKQSDDRKRPFKNKKGYTKQDLENRATDLMRHASDMRDQQFGIGKFRPEDEEEYQRNLTKAAIHHMAFMQNFAPSKLSREWDPYTKKFEINGLDVLKRRRDASENYHNHTEDVFGWAQDDLETDEDGTRPSNIYRPIKGDYYTDEDDEYYELTDDEYMRGDMYHPDEIKNNLQFHHL